jgi:hypothetical protein
MVRRNSLALPWGSFSARSHRPPGTNKNTWEASRPDSALDWTRFPITAPAYHHAIMKLGKACRQCRDGKRKCDRAEPGVSCVQCLRRGFQCSSAIATLKNPQLTSLPQPTDPCQPSRRNLPPPLIVRELCELYISNIHDKPHTLFHEPTLRRDVADGTASEAILYGIMGLSAR